MISLFASRYGLWYRATFTVIWLLNLAAVIWAIHDDDATSAALLAFILALNLSPRYRR